MTDQLDGLGRQCATDLRMWIRRHRLVFLQAGAIFSPLLERLLPDLGGTVRSAVDFARATYESDARGVLVLTDLDDFVEGSVGERMSLGVLRQRVGQALDRDQDVCLVSRRPRFSYRRVPGSSLLEDASPFYLPLPDGEHGGVFATGESDFLTSLGHPPDDDRRGLYRRVLSELGVDLLASLDRVVYEVSLDKDVFLSSLDAREIDSLRGAGLATMPSPEERLFTLPRQFSEFREELANVLAEFVVAQPELAVVSEELWGIERRIRLRLRRYAMEEYSKSWKTAVVHGDLAVRVLDRARLDSYVQAKTVRQLRDPIEWLTLGELGEVVRSEKFQGLGLDGIFWARFFSEIVPIRNRLSHMRLLKTGDRQTVGMWASTMRSVLP